jgi:DNA polymerase I
MTSDLLGVDGSSLAHRAWHSTRGDADVARAGVVTAAFASMLASTWRYGPYRVLLVAFDDRENQRRADFPEYKAQRAPTAPGLRDALDLVAQHLGQAGVAVRVLPGAEADDVLAATADDARGRGWACDLLSSDRDLTALVGGPVRLLRPKQRFADLAVEDEDAVRATYGVDPARYIDLAALRGDTSDGLDGATGIGPTWAARLVRDHGDVTGIYRALPDLPPRIATALREGRARVERNLLLMSPLPHLDADLDGAAAAGAPLGTLADLLEDLGFAPAAGRLRRALDGQDPRPTTLPPLPPPPDVAPTEPSGPH